MERLWRLERSEIEIIMSSDNNIEGLDATMVAHLANAKPKGKRPEYFDDSMSENHFSITMALVTELAVARERIDTLERLLASKGLLSQNEVEDYIPDSKSAEQRQLAQVEYSARIFRAMQQELERVAGDDKSMDEMAEVLGVKESSDNKLSDNND